MKKLKCWKKSKVKSNVWYHKKIGDEVAIWDNQKDIYGKKALLVRIYKNNNIIHKYPKDMKEALKFANKYMKKHNQC